MFKRRGQFDMNANLRNVETPSQTSKILPKMSSEITLPPKIQQAIMAELPRDLPLSPTLFKDIATRLYVEKKYRLYC